MDLEPDEAREALEQIGEQRRRSAEKASAPTGYYFLLGMALALFCLSYPVEGAASWGFLTPGVVFLVLGMGMYTSKASKMSFRSWVATFTGRNAWIAWTLLLVAWGSLIASSMAESFFVSVPAALVALATFGLLGPRWDSAWVESRKTQP